MTWEVLERALPSANSSSYIHFGWEVSPFSAKTRWYLSHRGLLGKDVHPHIFSIKRNIESKLGFTVMPVVHGPNGEILQDTTCIVDCLEGRHTERTVRPQPGAIRVLDRLLELFGDEWMPIVSMHTRWNNTENARFAVNEFGRNALPWVPKFIQRRVGSVMGKKLSSYLPLLGIHPESQGEIDKLMEELLGILEAILESRPYLLGNVPCVADFSIAGQLYAHGYRDPGTTHLFDGFQKVRKWIETLKLGKLRKEDLKAAEWDAPLQDLVSFVCRWGLPLWLASTEATQEWAKQPSKETRVPRGMGRIDLQLGHVTVQRAAFSYHQWMLQHVLDDYQQCSPTEKARLKTLLESTDSGDSTWIEQRVEHPLVMLNYRLHLTDKQSA